MEGRRELPLATALAMAGCAIAAPPRAATPSPTATAAPAISAPAQPAAATGDGAPLLSFWLLADHGPWRSTLYALDGSGQLHEEETVSVGSAAANEAAGTLRWIDGCGSPRGCHVRRSCPLGGRVLAPPDIRLADGCEPLRLSVVSTCSDGAERRIKLGFDDRCGSADGAAAFIYVEGEPVFDGRNAGWERITHAVYLPCRSLSACRARFAAMGLDHGVTTST